MVEAATDSKDLGHKCLTKEEKESILLKMKSEEDQKLKIREQNLKFLKEREALPKTLVSKFDKIQKFLTKLKNLKEEHKKSIIEEIGNLNLSRYTDEVIDIIVNSKMTTKEIPILQELCRIMHKRYDDFSVNLMPALHKHFSSCSLDEEKKAVKRRSMLKLMSELYLTGVTADISKIGKSVIELTLRDKSTDKEKFINNMTVFASYLKQYGELIFGLYSRSARIAFEQGYQVKFQRHSFISEKQQEKLTTHFKSYFKQCCDFLLEEHELLKEQEKKLEDNRREIDIDQDIERKYKSMKSGFDKLMGNIQGLSDLLNIDIPFQIEEKVTRLDAKKAPRESTSKMVISEHPFQDDVELIFYRELPDLSGEIQEGEVNQQVKDESILKKKEENLRKDFEQFGIILFDCMTKELADKAAIQFCKINSKGNRKRLGKVLFNIPRTALPLIPFYARIAASINKYFKDIGQFLVDLLEKEFQELYEVNDLIKIETKIRNIRFLGELTKFELCSPNIMFECFKMCLKDFTGHNVDIICHLLETCGLYLGKLPATQLRFNNTLDFMWKIKNTKYLSQQTELNIENAYYLCKYPDRTTKKPKKRDVYRSYIKYLICQKLEPNNIDEVAGLLSELPQDEITLDYIVRNFIKLTFYGKYNDMHLVSCLLAALKKFMEVVCIKVVDGLAEDIRTDLENNDYKQAQHRVLAIRFLAELYNYRIINSEIIFTILYQLIGQLPLAGVQDPVDDSFRVRLVCTLLEGCGKYFQKGDKKIKMDKFLIYFQRYIHTKSYLSVDLEFLILDTLEGLRPKYRTFSSLEEAENECKRIEELEKNLRGTGQIEGNEEEDEAMEMDEEFTKLTTEEEPTLEDEEEVYKRNEMITVHDEDIFNREFNTMMTESLRVARHQTNINKKIISVPLPILDKRKEGTQILNDENNVEFKIITKKGNKTQTKKIEIPKVSKLVIGSQKTQVEEEVKKEEVKELTLRMVDKEDEDMFPRVDHALNSGNKPKKKKYEEKVTSSRKKIHLTIKDFNE